MDEQRLRAAERVCERAEQLLSDLRRASEKNMIRREYYEWLRGLRDHEVLLRKDIESWKSTLFGEDTKDFPLPNTSTKK